MSSDTNMKGSRKRIKPDLGVSETIGFIIIFGITITGIALVTLYGYPALINAQADANIRNMERNMIVIQSDVNALVYKSVPYKETTMQVSGGVLSVQRPDPASSFFIIKDSGVSLLDTVYPDDKFPPGELHFLSDSDNIYVGLENGAVVKNQAGGSVMLSEPRWFIDTDTAGFSTMVIPLIQVEPSQPMAKDGISTVQLSIEPLPIGPGETNVIDQTPDGNEVQISITTADKFYNAWKNYFENTLQMTKITGSDPPTWRKTGIDRVIVKAWKVKVINI